MLITYFFYLNQLLSFKKIQFLIKKYCYIISCICIDYKFFIMSLNIKKALQTCLFGFIGTFIFSSCGLQENYLRFYNETDVAIYRSTIETIYQEQRITEELKNYLLTENPKFSYVIYVLNKEIEAQYPGYNGNFRYIGISFVRDLAELTIELEKGEGLKLITPENTNIDDGNISYEEGFIKQIASIYGLFFIHKPEVFGGNDPRLLIVAHSLNMKAIKISGGQEELLKIENFKLLLSQVQLIKSSLDPFFSLVKNEFVDFNAFIGAINIFNNNLKDIQKLKIQQVIDLMNGYRLMHNLPQIF